jgi:hypothetical protein
VWACSNDKNRTKVLTIDPFNVNGMTVVSSIKDGKLTPYASNFSATVQVPFPETGVLYFKAIGLHSPSMSVFVNDKLVWKPDISGFKDAEDSPAVPVSKTDAENGNLKLTLAVRGFNGGLQIFEVYK